MDTVSYCKLPFEKIVCFFIGIVSVKVSYIQNVPFTSKLSVIFIMDLQHFFGAKQWNYVSPFLLKAHSKVLCQWNGRSEWRLIYHWKLTTVADHIVSGK